MRTNKRSRVMQAVCLILTACLMFALAVPGFAAEANEKVMDAKKGVVQIEFWYVDPDIPGLKIPVHSGTGFLINQDTVVTCQHIAQVVPDMYIAWAAEVNELAREFPEFKQNRTPKEVQENCQIRISVLRDVFVEAKLKQVSEEMDYAILVLDEQIHNRAPLPLRKSSSLKQTETVYALGFPGDIQDMEDIHTYNAEDVTITTGTVNKVDTFTMVVNEDEIDEHLYNNVYGVESSAKSTRGNSGGPLLDENGNVVGINAASSSIRNIAVATDPLIETLDALGIEYTPAENAVPAAAPAETEKPTEAPAATEAPTEAPAPTAAPTAAPAVTEAPTEVTIPAPVPDPVPGPNWTLIIGIAAAAVVVVVLIIVLASKGKKKPEPRKQAPAPQPVHAANTAGFQSAPSQPLTAPTQNTGAGETTVLSADAGETTVLNRSVSGGYLIRKRSGEQIPVNVENFVIGRERKSVNYCITDNTSVSRSHVRLSVRADATYLVDLGGKNGTFVNGVKLSPNQEIALKSGDKITLADEEFEYRK